ncbi:MAG: transglycosylase SLT domain-containing protein [Clostridia bacterium]|nr:transglycosylase SLT domain-containing protein [Clostridia bacterium]
MKVDKAHIIRKSFIVITLILIVATTGLFLVSFQVKKVSVNYFGETKSVKTLATTVQSFILENKITLSENMIVEPALNEKIEKNTQIKIYSKDTVAKIEISKLYEGYSPTIAKVEEVVDVIGFKEEQINNASINRGTTKVVTEGKNGEKVTRYVVKYNGSTEIYRAQIDSKVTSEPQNKVIEIGTRLNNTVSRSATVISPSALETDANFKQYNIKLPVEQQKYAYNMCKQYGIQYELFLAMMYKESGYNPSAIGGGNSYGLTQIHISNHAKLRIKLGISNFLDPYDNIKAGAYMLALYFGSARKMAGDDAIVEVYALNCYNMGESSYFNNCYSKGIVNRGYSTSIRGFRDRLISTGGI